MSSSGKPKRRKGGGGGGDAQRSEQPLQAVILADSFTKTFRPITLEQPKVLLPLANVPMIEYTLEFLAEAGVAEVFVFCCSHCEKVVEYIANSRWAKRVPRSSQPALASSPARSFRRGRCRRAEPPGSLAISPVILLAISLAS